MDDENRTRMTSLEERAESAVRRLRVLGALGVIGRT